MLALVSAAMNAYIALALLRFVAARGSAVPAESRLHARERMVA